MEADAGPRDRAAGWRVALWLGLILGWLVMLLYAWSAFTTFPSEERLQTTRMARIPTLATVGVLAARSAAELSALLALLWPWRSRLWLTRTLVAAAGLAVWFILTTPLTVTALDQVHRRWLALMVPALIVAAAAGAAARQIRRR